MEAKVSQDKQNYDDDAYDVKNPIHSFPPDERGAE
jgi:hypothetical protein